MGGQLKKFLALFISFGVTILTVELWVRANALWVDRDLEVYNIFQPSKDERFPYTYKPHMKSHINGIKVVTNSLGLRDAREPSATDCFRILVVGGSITAGYGVSNSQTFSAALQMELEKSLESCVHVVNAGQLAFTAPNITGFLKSLVPIYKPDAVIYSVNRFALNDSFRANDNGSLTQDFKANVVRNYLATTWKLPRRLLPLGQPVQEGGDSLVSFVEPQEYQGRWFSHFHSYLYFSPFFRSLVSLSEKSSCTAKSCLEYRPSFIKKNGYAERLQEYSPLILSPKYTDRLYLSLNEAALFLAREKLPTLFLTQDIFLDFKRLGFAENQVAMDVGEIAGYSAKYIFEKHNLVWDFHLTPKGNQIIAKGLSRFLQDRGWVAGGSSLGEQKYDFEEYRSHAMQRRKEMVRAISSEVNIAEKINIHQLIGGFHPNSKQNGMKLSLLLKHQSPSMLRLQGKAEFEGLRHFRVEFWEKGKQVIRQIQVAPGEIDITIESLNLNGGLVNVELICLDEACDTTRFDHIGFF